MAGASPRPEAGRRRARADIDLDAEEAAGRALAEESSLGELISRSTRDLSQLMRDEIELAKVEIKAEARTAGRAGAKFGVTALLGYLSLSLLCFAAAWGLSEVMPEGLAFLVVAIVVGALAGIAFGTGRRDLESFEPVPTETVETIQEDVQWARQLKS